MTYSPEKYGKLLLKTLPGVISDDNEYDRIESVFNTLISKGEERMSAEEARLFELLANLLEDYERRTLPPLPDVAPADALRFLMDENELKQTDLSDVFGSQAVVSKVLNGKRTISKAQAKRLAARFRVSTDLFI
jgi:HTH-type transcriptional regulator/antitoxin HigA